ncbi:MAG: MFS transporter [Candidatus Curtissbacteria bacterium]|nr:MFS transporter [Candidatus Curtissbacteria bacterium]
MRGPKAKNQVSFRKVFKNRPFMTLWINQILLQLSYNMLNVSLIILVFRLTNSNIIAATFILMTMLPVIIFGIFAGVVADRFDKRKILLATDIGIGIAMLLFLPVQDKVALILAVAFLLNIFFQFFMPAEAAALPTIVPRGDLFAANALFQFTPTAALIIGASLAGPIVANFGYNPIFIFGSAAMLATFFVRRALPALPPEAHMAYHRKEGIIGLIVLSKKHAAMGLRFIFSDNRIWISIVILSFVQAAFSTVAALAPGFMEQVLKIEATDASIIILMPLGIGALFSAYLTVKFWNKIPIRTLVVRGLLICGAALILMALTPVIGRNLAHGEFLVSHIRPFSKAFTVSFWVSIFSLIMGFGAAQIIIPAQTSLQKHTRSAYRGRVFASWVFLTSVSVVFPSLIAGAVADIFGVTQAMTAAGIVIVLASFIGFRGEWFLAHFSPKFLRLAEG